MKYWFVMRNSIAKMAKRFDHLVNVFTMTGKVWECLVKKRLPELGLVLLLTTFDEKGFPEHKRERRNKIVGNYKTLVEFRI